MLSCSLPQLHYQCGLAVPHTTIVSSPLRAIEQPNPERSLLEVSNGLRPRSDLLQVPLPTTHLLRHTCLFSLFPRYLHHSIGDL